VRVGEQFVVEGLAAGRVALEILNNLVQSAINETARGIADP
jgi:hypothetical protein